MRSPKSVALTIAGVIFAALPANSLRAEVRVQGQAGDVRVEAHDATVAEILAALGERFALRYRGTTGSDGVTAIRVGLTTKRPTGVRSFWPSNGTFLMCGNSASVPAPPYTRV